MSRGIVWFRNDLRTTDNAVLLDACTAHSEVLPLFVLDPRIMGVCPFGFGRMASYRAHFLQESVLELAADLERVGSGLRMVVGDPVTVIPELAHAWKARCVHVQHDPAWEESMQECSLARQVDLRVHPPATLLHPDDLPFTVEELPHVFTAFRKKVEKDRRVRAPLPVPDVPHTPQDWSNGFPEVELEGWTPGPSRDPRAVMRFHGGREAGQARLRHYLWDTRSLSTYKLTRNDLMGADHSSKFSPWLANGCLSPREVHAEVVRYEAEHGANESTYWLVFELLWRDLFRFRAEKHGPRIFRWGGPQARTTARGRDAERFRRWVEGRTGQPFIDANMRELWHTGWMSNRGRQNVASYLVHDLQLDWRMGAWWFERMLIDHDACSNWGNWQYLAGVGNDPREGRRFDPERQAALYDPEGTYVEHWREG